MTDSQEDLQRRVRRQAWDNVAKAYEAKASGSGSRTGWCSECGAPWVKAEYGRAAYCVVCLSTYPSYDGQRAALRELVDLEAELGINDYSLPLSGVEEDPED